MVEQFTYRVSHDLRTPLTSMRAYLQVLQKKHGEALGADGARYLARIDTRKTEDARIWFGNRSMNGGEGVIFVRDNGAGFPHDEAERLFEPFSRFHDPKEFEGTGLGLSTVQRVVERHGGHVWAQGEIGKGATICFQLPEVEA